MLTLSLYMISPKFTLTLAFYKGKNYEKKAKGIQMEIILKKYHETDKNKVKAITEYNYYEIFQKFTENTINLIFKNDILVGWIHLDLPESSLYSGFVFIYIAPEHRRKGIGTYVYRQAECQLKTIGCNWWSSYPESTIANRFAISVGFDYTNTNSYLVHDGRNVSLCTDGIRTCRIEDYPTAPDIWSREYAAMHIRIGLPYKKKELTVAEQEEEYDDFCKNLNNHFVIEVDKRIIGIGSLFDDNSGIGSLAVDSVYSGNGYGSRLAAFLTNECIKRGCPNPCIYCETGNDNAMHIYKKIGYVEQSRESIAIKS